MSAGWLVRPHCACCCTPLWKAWSLGHLSVCPRPPALCHGGVGPGGLRPRRAHASLRRGLQIPTPSPMQGLLLWGGELVCSLGGTGVVCGGSPGALPVGSCPVRLHGQEGRSCLLRGRMALWTGHRVGALSEGPKGRHRRAQAVRLPGFTVLGVCLAGMAQFPSLLPGASRRVRGL